MDRLASAAVAIPALPTVLRRPALEVAAPSDATPDDASLDPMPPPSEPSTFRIRLVRDAAAALCVLAALALGASLLARPAPTGAVLSATSGPRTGGRDAGTPGAAPALDVSSPSPSPTPSPGTPIVAAP